MGCECPWLNGTFKARQSSLCPLRLTGLAESRAVGLHSSTANVLGEELLSPRLQGQGCSSQVFKCQQSTENIQRYEHSAGNAARAGSWEPAGEEETTGAGYDGNGLPALTDKGLVSPGWESAARVCQVLTPGCSALGRQLQEGKLRSGSRSPALREAFLSSTPRTENWCFSS